MLQKPHFLGKENVKLKSNGSSGFTSAKNFIQPLNKPKGLSIRSKSDLNVSVSNNSGASKLNPKKTMPEDSKPRFSVRQLTSPMKLKASKVFNFHYLMWYFLSSLMNIYQ